MNASASIDRSAHERPAPHLSEAFFLSLFQKETAIHALLRKNRLAHSLHIPAKDWTDLEWHAREARYFNHLHDKRHRALHRILRPQGKINRLLLIAANKALAITRRITLFCQRELPLDAALREILPNCILLLESASTALDAARLANKPARESSPLQTRLTRDQSAFNSHLLASLRSISEIQTALRNHFIPNHESPCWNHITWHLNGLITIIHPRKRTLRVLKRLRTPQHTVNDFFSIALEQMVPALQSLDSSLQSLLQVPSA